MIKKVRESYRRIESALGCKNETDVQRCTRTDRGRDRETGIEDGDTESNNTGSVRPEKK